MKIGVIDILELPSQSLAQALYRVVLTKQFASITPQAVSAWCRQLGHDVSYATYYGIGKVHGVLPPDLDVVFVSCFTRTSPIAYALAKQLREAGTMTVIGGPHARSFPRDCLRFFDLVVHDCDRQLVADILSGQYDHGSAVSSDGPFGDVPTVAERLPEIRASALYWGKRRPPLMVVPMLSSTGCPYGCDFCMEHDRAHRPLPTERLADDLAAANRLLPGAVLGFHDPNFAINFDDVISVFEAAPRANRVPYMIESSLSVLVPERIQRLKDTRCLFVAPGIESWTGFSGKAAAGASVSIDKVDRIAAHLRLVQESVPIVQVNLILGLDSDTAAEQAELSKAFMERTPCIWSSFTVATPFGGTPLFDRLVREGRMLRSMPFALYDTPYLASILNHDSPVTFYEELAGLLSHSASTTMLKRRLKGTSRWSVRAAIGLRTAAVRGRASKCNTILEQLRTEQKFRDFHEGRNEALPEFYRHEFERKVGRDAALLTTEDRIPVLDPLASVNSSKEAHSKPSSIGTQEAQ